MSGSIPPAPFSWSTLLQGLKIFTVVVIFLSAQQGVQAFTNTFDGTKLMVAGELFKVFSAAAMGVAFGAIQGTLRAVEILMVIWAGPTLWGYLGPILTTAAAMVSLASAGLVRTIRGIFRKEPPAN